MKIQTDTKTQSGRVSIQSGIAKKIHSISAVVPGALPLVLLATWALTPFAAALNFSESGGWKAPTSLDTVSTHRGDPVKLSWSIPPDGSLIAYPYWYPCTSNLNAVFTQQVGASYKDVFTFIFGRIGAVSGLQFFPCPDDGTLVDENRPGIAGVRGDIRVVASDLSSGLGYGGSGWANMPHPGGCCGIHLNTGIPWDSTNLLKITMHESGHTIGFAHQSIYADLAGTTEWRTANGYHASITGYLNPEGPQFDDLYAMHRMYGDILERNGGNDTSGTATDLGNLTIQGHCSRGTQIHGLQVGPSDTDFLSIDGSSDMDCFKFHLDATVQVSIAVTPKGPTYAYRPEGGALQILQASRQSDLHFELLNLASEQTVAQVNNTGLGERETLSQVLEAGDYSISIAGTQDAIQFFRLDVATGAMIDPPAALAITASAGAGGTITPSGPVAVADGGSQTYIISPNTGYGISEVLIDTVNQPTAAATGSYTFSNVTADHVILVAFVAVLPPVFDLAAGTYAGAQSVTITAEAGTTIHYTSDGTDPKTSGTVISGPSPITGVIVPVATHTTLRAYATVEGYTNSLEASVPYNTVVIVTQYAAGTFTWDTASKWATSSGESYTNPWLSGNDACFEGTAGTVGIAAAGVMAHNITFNTTGYAIHNSTLRLTGTTPTLTLGTGISATISSSISGSAGLTKDGDGTLTLSGGSNFSGQTAIAGGTLKLETTTSVEIGTTGWAGTGSPGTPVGAASLIAGLSPTPETNPAVGGESTGAAAVLTNGANPWPGNANWYYVGNNASLTYTLPPGGAHITGVNLFSDWGDNGRSTITLTNISYSTVSAPATFIPIAGTNMTYTAGGAFNEVMFAATGGVMAANVYALQFNFGTQQNDAVGYGEIEVLGIRLGNLLPTTTPLSIASGSTLDLSNVMNQQVASLGVSDNSSLVFKLSNTSANLLAVTNAATANGTVNVTLDTTAATALTPGLYNLITADSGLTSGGAAWRFTGGGARRIVTVGGIAYRLTLEASDTAVSLAVATGASPAYDTWATSLASPAFDADSDHNGVSNGLQWILGGAPIQNDTAAIAPRVTGSEATGLTLVFNRTADSLAETHLYVEWGSDLASNAKCLVIGSTDVGPSGDNPTVDVDAPNIGQVTVNIPAANAPGGKLFARLKATQP